MERLGRRWWRLSSLQEKIQTSEQRDAVDHANQHLLSPDALSSFVLYRFLTFMDNKSLNKLRLNTKLTYVLMNFAGYNICVRHWLLRETIGTRPEEESSYNTVMKLLFGVPITVVGFSLLELGFYFLYNYKVDKIIVY